MVEYATYSLNPWDALFAEGILFLGQAVQEFKKIFHQSQETREI